MNKNYIRKSLTPEFEQIFKKQHPFWDAFVQYMLSEDSEEQKNKGTKIMQENRSTSIILGKEVMRWRFQNGRRCKMTSLQEESYHRLSSGRCEQNISYMLMEAH